MDTTTDINNTDINSELDTSMDIRDTREAPACAVCTGRHPAIKCRTLRRMGLSERVNKVRCLNLCFCCLKPGHGSRRCRERVQCKVVGCQRHHATLLHGASLSTDSTSMDTRRVMDTSAPAPSSAAVQSQGPDAQRQEVVFSGHVGEACVPKVALPIVAVKVKVSGSDDYVDTYALLDSGSARSFCTVELLDAVKIQGRTESVAVSTLAGYLYDHAIRTADLQVSDSCGRESLLLGGVHAKEGLPGLMAHMATEIDIDCWPHLRGLSFPQAKANQVGLIIGQDNAEALAPLSTIFGRRSEPFAVRTCLGWSLHGALVPARRAKEPSACLVAADCGGSELTDRQAQVVERGTQRSVRQNSDRSQRPSPSAGLKRSSGRRSKRRGRKELGVPSSRVVPVSLPAKVDQPTASSKAEPANRQWLRSVAKRRSAASLYRESCYDSEPLKDLQVSQNGNCIVKGRKRKPRQQQHLQP